MMSTEEIIHQIESRDRKFRTTERIFKILLVAALLGVIFIQFRTLDAVRVQLIQQKQTSETISKQSDEQRDKIIRRLDCMTAFFSQPDRSTLTITDVDKCSIDRTSPAEQFFTPATGQNNSNQPAQAQKNTPTTTAPTNNNNPVVPPTNDPPPFKVLGVPLCIPTTGVCVR